jgi:hypothetical protein
MTPTGLVQVAYGNGDGTFQPSVAAPGITPTSNGTALVVSALAVADLTGSGLSDIILGNTINGLSVNAASISIYKNNGHGSFTSLGNFPVSSGNVNAQGIQQILPVDMNGDGRLDVAVTIATGVAYDSYVYAAILLNNGDGTLTPPTATLGPVTDNEIGLTSFLVAGDFANRGKTDLVFLSNNEIDLYPGNGDGTLAPSILVTSGGNSYQLATEDLNGDGKLDLIDARGIAYLGNGDFTFTPANLLTSTAGTLLVADIDGDGLPDLLFNYSDNTGHQAVTIQLGSRSAIAVLPSIKSLAVGVHPVTANYVGDGNFSASTSTAVNVTVNKFTSTVTGTATPNPALATQSIKLSVQVSSTGPVATGNVTLTEGATVLGTAVLDAHGAGSANLTLATATSHNVTLNYLGDAFTLPSTTSVTVVTVASFPSNISLLTSPNPTVAGQLVTLSVVVTPTGSSPVPTGNVVFLSGSTQLGSAPLDSTGKATFNTSFPVIGNQTVTANYVGDTANQPSSASIVEAILSAFDFQPTSGSSAITVTHGSSATLPITVSSQNGFSGSVAFTCSNLPTGATCSFNPANVTVSGSTQGAVTLTVSTVSTVSSNSAVPFRDRQNVFEATAFWGCFLFLLPATHRNRRRLASLLCAALAIVAFGVAGCSGGTPAATVPTTYSFNVIATSGAVQKTIPYSLVVQ